MGGLDALGWDGLIAGDEGREVEDALGRLVLVPSVVLGNSGEVRGGLATLHDGEFGSRCVKETEDAFALGPAGAEQGDHFANGVRAGLALGGVGRREPGQQGGGVEGGSG